MTQTEAAVALRGVRKVYGRGGSAVRALDGVDLDLHGGTFTAVMGPSGSGKSTLLHCAAGLDRPTEGSVTLAGRDLARLSETGLTKLRRSRIGFVFQAFNLVSALTVRENILLPSRLAGTRPDRRWLAEVVTRVGLDGRLRHRPAQLSGGEQQRVAFCRAVLNDPPVLLADEPTGNLDDANGAVILDALRERARGGAAVVVVSHRPEAAQGASAVYTLRGGVLERDGRSWQSREESA
jgi:putative ABC transport system ATP-binding protein